MTISVGHRFLGTLWGRKPPGLIQFWSLADRASVYHCREERKRLEAERRAQKSEPTGASSRLFESDLTNS